ncbi:replicative DNA helicase [Candidatus Sumerlaeota bacterium]|nr:replicative DNA helicase [Candidatus Sumerlaeota bacterium]
MALPEKIDATRILPHSPEAEASALGCMLLDNTTIALVVDHIQRDHFYNANNQLIFETILSLFEQNIPVDLTTLTTELQKTKSLEKAGGLGYIASLEDRVISPLNIEHYANIIRDKARIRRLILSSYDILETAYSEEMDASQLIDYSEKLIFEISQERISRDFRSIGDLTIKTLEDVQRRYHDKHEVTGIATEFYKLDELTSGLQRSDLIILAARPSKGKTAFGLNIALNVAVHNNLPVGIFSLEMSAEQLNQRLISTLAKVSSLRIRTGFLTEGELKRLSEYGRKLSEMPIFIDDTPGISVLELRAKARRLKSRTPDLSLLIVDYLQLMHSGGKIENRQQEVAEISRSMKALSRELNIPVIAISQLSRMIEHRSGKDKKPMLSDLRESGAIEQDADVVMFIHPEPPPEGSPEEEGEESEVPLPAQLTEIIIAKQRNGPLGNVKLLFFPEFMLFSNPPPGA